MTTAASLHREETDFGGRGTLPYFGDRPSPSGFSPAIPRDYVTQGVEGIGQVYARALRAVPHRPRAPHIKLALANRACVPSLRSASIIGARARVSLESLAACPARSLRADDRTQRAQRERNPFLAREPVPPRPGRVAADGAAAWEPRDVREPRLPARPRPAVGPHGAPLAGT